MNVASFLKEVVLLLRLIRANGTDELALSRF